MEDCIFCKIIKGEIPSYKVYEDKFAVAFLDINPLAKGHTLVVSKSHVEHLSEMDPKEVGRLFRAVTEVGHIIMEKMKPEGLNYFVNEGEVAGQIIPHVHCHVVPRNQGDGMKFHGDTLKLSEDEMMEIADKLEGGYQVTTSSCV